MIPPRYLPRSMGGSARAAVAPSPAATAAAKATIRGPILFAMFVITVVGFGSRAAMAADCSLFVGLVVADPRFCRMSRKRRSCFDCFFLGAPLFRRGDLLLAPCH